MARAGVVNHPSEWSFGGYNEIAWSDPNENREGKTPRGMINEETSNRTDHLGFDAHHITSTGTVTDRNTINKAIVGQYPHVPIY